MRIHSAIIAVAGAVAAAGCATAQAPRPLAVQAECAGLDTNTLARLYAPGKVKKVEPTYRQVFLARAIQPRYVSGASIYVPAEPGMHEAYLERALSCRAASLRAQHATDPLAVEGITDVDVRAVGAAMRISITGADRTAGKAIWDRTRALHRQGDVSVEQLAVAADGRAL